MFKFNNGQGAVICDNCRVVIDEGISLKEAEECYGEVAYCYECTHGHKVGEGSDDCGACNAG